MDFFLLPYDRLPEFIRENEKLRQIMLQSGGIMKYIVEHIDDPVDEDSPLLFAQYQNYVAENYLRVNRWNPKRQTWSAEDLRKRALDADNHLRPEFQSRRVLMQTLHKQTDISNTVKMVLDNLSLEYYSYAWKEDLRRRRPDIDTDLGTYKYVIEQFERFGWPIWSNGLACLSMDIVLMKHHGVVLTDQDNYDYYNIEMFHTYFSWPTIIDRLERGLAELLKGKNTNDRRAAAVDMLNRVKWFSQHIYNDEVEDVLNDSFTIEDKRWLRGLLEHYDRDSFRDEEFNFFYFGKLYADIVRLWEKEGIDLSELEIKTQSFINIDRDKIDSAVGYDNDKIDEEEEIGGYEVDNKGGEDEEKPLIFDSRIKEDEVIRKIEELDSENVHGARRWYVFYRVFDFLEWLDHPTHPKFISWVEYHFGWKWGTKNFKAVQKEFKKNPTNWGKIVTITKKGKKNKEIGPNYYSFADNIVNAFMDFDDNGMHDKEDYLSDKNKAIKHHNKWK